MSARTVVAKAVQSIVGAHDLAGSALESVRSHHVEQTAESVIGDIAD
jgi:hypothetical protein